MSFITSADLENALYPHIIDEIKESNTAAEPAALSAAEQTVESYLAQRYDTETIFSQTGDSRNAMIVEICLTIAVWNFIKLCNAETLYDIWRDRYEDAIRFLEKTASGELAPKLPPLRDEQGNTVNKIQITSNPKFRHSW